MTTSNGFTLYVTDLLAPLGEMSVGRMFGGTLLKHRGKQLGIVMGDILYFRISEKLQDKYKSHGSKPFQYRKKTGLVTVKAYWSVPDDVIEDREALVAWAEEVLH